MAAHTRRRNACRALTATAVLAVGLTLAGCANYDEHADLEQKDYEDLIARRGAEQVKPQDEPPIPDLQPILAAPTPPDLADQRRVTVRVTEDTPLRDVFIELARKAGVGLELDPRIEGGVIFFAEDRPFRDVVRRLTTLAGLRYTFEDNTLRVELDEPYTRNYRVDVLNMKRTATSSISASTDVFTVVGGGGSSGSNGSNARIERETVNDFWEEVKEGIANIVGERAPTSRLVTPAAPQPGAAAAQAAPAPAYEAGGPPAAEGVAATAATSVSGGPAAPAEAAAGGAEDENPEYFSVNRSAGVITVFATERKHRKIAEYLADLRASTSSQVLIQAKVVEVELSDEFRAGIDWSILDIPGVDFAADTNLRTAVIPVDRTDASLRASFSASPFNMGISGVLDLLDTFGTARTLSSPRLTVTNNESALLKVAENDVYFTLEIEEEEDDDTGDVTTRFESEVHTVPIGLLMAVQPSIDTQRRRVTLNLRPTISRIVDRRDDPAVQLQAARLGVDVQSSVPVVEVREMESVVTMRDGAVLVMGGLMQERQDNEDEKVPGIGDVPVVGNAFRKQLRNTTMTELVVFLEARIVDDRDTVHPADVELYNKFAPDPRPIAF